MNEISQPQRPQHPQYPGQWQPLLTAGEVLRESLQTFRANFGPVMLIHLFWSFLPLALSIFAAVSLESTEESFKQAKILNDFGGVLQFLFSIPAQGAVVLLVVAYQEGKKVPVGTSFAQGFRTLGPVLLVSWAVGILVAGIALLSLVPAAILIQVAKMPLIMMVFFLIPALIVLMALSVAVPVTVMEGKGVRESLERSRDLTQDCRWTIFSTIFFLGIAQMIITEGFSLVLLVPGELYRTFPRFIIVTSCLNVVFIAFQAVMIAVVYTMLKKLKDRSIPEQLADVFR